MQIPQASGEAEGPIKSRVLDATSDSSLRPSQVVSKRHKEFSVSWVSMVIVLKNNQARNTTRTQELSVR